MNDEQIHLFKKMREKISNLFLDQTKNIDTLMKNRVDDYILIEEQPLSIKIGDKYLFIGNFTIENNYKFWHLYGKLMSHLGIKFLNFDILGSGTDLYEFIIIHKNWYKGMIKIIKKTLLKQQAYYLNEYKEREKINWKNMNWRYFKKRITIEKLMQICHLIYLYNFDAEKKNWQVIQGKWSIRELMQTYIYSWLQHSAGISGNFLLAQLPNLDYWHNESMRQEISLTKNQTKKNSSKLIKR